MPDYDASHHRMPTDPTLSAASAPARARRQAQLEALTAATMRALSGRRDLHFRARRLFHGAQPLPHWAPYLHPPLESTHDFDIFRGAADGIALRLAFSDAALHRRLVSAAALGTGQGVGEGATTRMLFEVFEQLRVEALAYDAAWAMPGLRRNLHRAFGAWSRAFHAAGHTGTARGLLVYCIVQMVRTRLTGEEAVEPDEGLLEATRASLGPVLGTSLAAMRRHVHDQAAYAEPALDVARHIAAMLQSADDEDGGVLDKRADEDEDDDDTRTAFNFWIEPADASFEERAALAASGCSVLLEAPGERYRIYSTTYDRELEAGALARKEELAALRTALDAHTEAARLNLVHVARDLKALLARPSADGWQGALEEGRIDGRRLAQLISSPTERRLFRDERIEPRADALVTVLIDCSGSMRAHAEQVAVLADVLARALGMAGAACEILGFTTGAWSGGRAARDWQRAGRPHHPGRLNEALHIVFKGAHVPWRRARAGLAALLKPDLFREGIDGEAVAWALARQESFAAEQAVPAERRWLIVISDGSPMDSATHQANDRHYLDHHLRDVVARADITRARIFGLGVGLDLSPYYRRSHVLDLAGGIDMTVLREVTAHLARGSRR
jgi:cobaltochelatase CobT